MMKEHRCEKACGKIFNVELSTSAIFCHRCHKELTLDQLSQGTRLIVEDRISKSSKWKKKS